MRRIWIVFMLLIILAVPVNAAEYIAPTVPQSGRDYMPETTESFGEGLWFVVTSAIEALRPEIAEAASVCLSLIATVVLVSLTRNLSDASKRICDLAGTITVGILLLQPVNTLINLGTQTVCELSEYGKLLLPVLTAALAANGGAATSAALYTATAFFISILSSLVTKLLVPMVYIFLCLCTANSAIGVDQLKKLKDFLKWLMTWLLKILLYTFTGYISITGVVSGSVDASALKATKIAVSGAVPVVGSIISDASETILVSAGIMKNSAGVYGLLAILSVCIGPFFKIGIQYLLLKLTAGICAVFDAKQAGELIQDFSGAMGMVLAMTGTQCVLLLVSVVCFMRGAT